MIFTFILYFEKLLYMMNLADMSPEEIVTKVESGEIKSCNYGSFAEYVRAMES